MKPVAIYHLWADPKIEPSPGRNIRTPVIMSIATLRGHTDMPIYVLDYTPNKQDWGCFDKQLNFTVLQKTHVLDRYRDLKGGQILSRFFDVDDFAMDIPEDLVFYMDTDVFWFKSPSIRHDPSKFCFNGYNNGFFYYNKNAVDVRKFFELYKAFVLTAINDDNFRYITRQYIKYDYNHVFVHDEAISSYIYHKRRDLVDRLDVYDHFTPYSPMPENDIDNLDIDNLDISKLSMVHCNGIVVRNELQSDWRGNHARGLACLLIRELYESAMKGTDITQCFSKEELDHYLPSKPA